MSEVHFKVDSITRITLAKRKRSEYRWTESRPEKRGFFGLIRLKKALPAGWAYDDDCDREELKDILCYHWYGFDESKNEIYRRPEVVIRLLEKGEIIHRFDSDTDAITWIDDIVAQAGSKFVVIGR
jgi:hypothetical protein